MAGAAEDSAGLAAADVSASSMGATKCRFFENEFPEVDECVMVRVESIAEMGAYVRLLEYGGIEGMVLLSELSRRRIRSINKLLRVNTNEVVMVTRVDREKGYIDLSKRRVSSEERTVAETRFTEAKAVRDAGVSGSWEHWPWRAAGRQAMPPPLHCTPPPRRPAGPKHPHARGREDQAAPGGLVQAHLLAPRQGVPFSLRSLHHRSQVRAAARLVHTA